MSDKRSDFLWIVQMIMLNHQDGVIGWDGVSGDAVAASHRIPADITARDAALDFCSVFIKGFAGDEPIMVPDWMAQLRDPDATAYQK